MDRRTFLKNSTFGAMVVPWLKTNAFLPETHIITLSFDDGFKKSFYKTADIFESVGLKACFNVVASGHLPSFKGPDNWISPELLGNFDDWNHLKEKGHEVMPHSWEHANLTQMPYEAAVTRIDKCLNYFEEHLEGFSTSEAVFNFPFNASTPELEAYALSQVRAIRTGGTSALNELPADGSPLRLRCRSMGPDNIDKWIETEVNHFLESKGGWLILNTHGLDDEGWGPVSSSYLTKLLNRLIGMEHVIVLPAGELIASL